MCPTKLDCKYNGYTDPLRCEKCRCPVGFAGQLCEDIVKQDLAKCGATEWEAFGDEKILYLPQVTNRGKCVYRIKASPGYYVKLEIRLQNFYCDSVCASYIEVKYLQDKSSTGK